MAAALGWHRPSGRWSAGIFDVMLLTKTKIQSEAYSHNHLGYDVACLAAQPSSAGGSQGGVGLVTRERLVG